MIGMGLIHRINRRNGGCVAAAAAGSILGGRRPSKLEHH